MPSTFVLQGLKIFAGRDDSGTLKARRATSKRLSNPHIRWLQLGVLRVFVFPCSVPLCLCVSLCPVWLRLSRAGVHPCFIRGSACLFLACFIVGCSSGDKLARYKVTGKVTYQGQPVEEGQITFEDPTAGQVNSSALGSGGSYSTELPAGDYRVSVAPPLVEFKSTADTPPDMVEKKVNNIPKKYRTQEKSGLSAQVAKDKRSFDFDLKP